jgi:hypothetical protein
LDIDQDDLDEQMRSLQGAIATALDKHPGRRVQVTWRLV